MVCAVLVVVLVGERCVTYSSQVATLGNQLAL